MLRILEVTVPFFGLVGLGWLAARRGWLPMEAIPGLNRFVLYFALPCMLFRFAAATPVARLFDAAVFGSWLLCALLMVALAIVLTKWSNPRGGLGWNDVRIWMAGALATDPAAGCLREEIEHRLGVACLAVPRSGRCAEREAQALVACMAGPERVQR